MKEYVKDVMSHTRKEVIASRGGSGREGRASGGRRAHIDPFSVAILLSNNAR